MRLTLTDLTPPGAGAPRDLLVLGPSLGTGVVPLWSACAPRLGGGVRVLGWDLPGHGRSEPYDKPFTVADLAAAVLEAVAPERAALGAGSRLLYAGVSLGGAVGLRLAIDQKVDALAVLGSAPVLGEPASWAERAALVRSAGTPAVLVGSAGRWFAPGFLERHPDVGTALLWSLQEADRFSYSRCCEALAELDLRAGLPSIAVPVLAVAGAHDEVAPPDVVAAMAHAIPDGRYALLPDAAHLAPAEAPDQVAALLRPLIAGAR